MDSPIEKTKKVKITCTKKIELSDKEQQEKKTVKPKCERFKKKLEAFQKARETMMMNAALRKEKKRYRMWSTRKSNRRNNLKKQRKKQYYE